MCDTGVLYSEYLTLSGGGPIASVWSYQTLPRHASRPVVRVDTLGDCEYWLERWDPLLNTMLPSTQLSVVFNRGDAWAAGRSLVSAAPIPPACVMGGMTRQQILQLGRSIDAVGVVLPTAMAWPVFGVEPSMLVDCIVPLSELWPHDVVDALTKTILMLDARSAARTVMHEVSRRACGRAEPMSVGAAASRLVQSRRGRVSIGAVASSYGMGRRQFGREFQRSTGMPPKLFARITRFQSLVQLLLATNVRRWASMATELGFYDQAHLINEFSAFAGCSPRQFFLPRATELGQRVVHIDGRPSEWVRDAAVTGDGR